eukprot:4980231-Karenia_brevis.AAC.1
MELLVLKGPSQKHQKIRNVDIAWGDTAKSAEIHVASTFTSVQALKSTLFTMALAGSYRVTRN